MGGFAEYDLSEDGDGGNVLALSGPYLVSTVGAIDQDLRALDGPIARIILNKPEKANVQTEGMVWSVNDCLDDAQYDYDIKVVIIKANGKGFCSGHDPSGQYPSFIAERAASGGTWRGPARLFLWPVLKLWEFPKPTIAQVHGYCIGGGTT